jgi:ring-1,2-phenylacetyl-CoA epoxidase subunit PaaD
VTVRTTAPAPEPPAAETRDALRDKAMAVARTVTDPEMPMLTLEDLGVLRSVEVDDEGHVVVAITPTYTGCPAMATMRDDLVRSLAEAGLPDARVRVSLSPAWSSDWITERGRRALADHGLSAPGPAPARSGPVALSLTPTRREIACPRCGSAQIELTSEFGPTACKALYRCTSCLEPFEHVKEI